MRYVFILFLSLDNFILYGLEHSLEVLEELLRDHLTVKCVLDPFNNLIPPRDALKFQIGQPFSGRPHVLIRPDEVSAKNQAAPDSFGVYEMNAFEIA